MRKTKDWKNVLFFGIGLSFLSTKINHYILSENTTSTLVIALQEIFLPISSFIGSLIILLSIILGVFNYFKKDENQQ